MFVYVAAPYPARGLVKAFSESLAEHTCTSTWAMGREDTQIPSITEGTVGPTLDLDHETVQQHALGDFEDITRADAVIMLTGDFVEAHVDGPKEWLHTGGRHVEVGYALALGIPVVVVGDPENVFERTLCLNAGSLSEALALLTETRHTEGAPA